MTNNHKDNNTCPSCGFAIELDYCSKCGEQKLNGSLRSLKNIVFDFAEDLTSLNGKFWKSVLLLSFKPGHYDYNYHIGKRVNYTKPVTLFLLINILFILFSPFTDFFVNLYDQLNLQPYSAWIAEGFNNRLLQLDMSYEEFSLRYDQLVIVLSRTLIILQVPIFMLFVSVFFYKKDYYLSDHFIFALNAHSWLLLASVVLQVSFTGLNYVFSFIGLDINVFNIYYTTHKILIVLYLLFAAKKLYQFNWLRTISTVFILLFALRLSHTAFRFVQFLITAYSV